MIITKTPFRISFFGGGTDYPIWYNKHGGKTISSSINKYSYIVLKKLPNFFDYKFRIRYFYREEVKNTKQIKHPTIRNTFNYFKIKSGLDLLHFSDLPSMSGMASSSAFTVGLIKAISESKLPKKMKNSEISNLARYVEQQLNNENIGSQDQIATTYGGFNIIKYSPKEKIQIKRINQKKILKKIQDNCLLFYSGIQRQSSIVTEDLINNIKSKENLFLKTKIFADEAEKLLLSNNFDIHVFGKLLNESWLYKKNTSNYISNEKLDRMYSIAIKSGALGGKILGAGSGGFMLICAPSTKHKFILKKMNKYQHINFEFEEKGTHAIIKDKF